jgi:hypothetical protein
VAVTMTDPMVVLVLRAVLVRAGVWMRVGQPAAVAVQVSAQMLVGNAHRD